MPDPLDTHTQSKKPIDKDKEMNDIVDKALAKRQARQKMAAACGDRILQAQDQHPYEKLAMLVPSVTKVLQNSTYGAGAGGFTPSVRTDSGNGHSDRPVSMREKQALVIPAALGATIGAPVGAMVAGKGRRAGGAGRGAGVGATAGVGASIGMTPGAMLALSQGPYLDEGTALAALGLMGAGGLAGGLGGGWLGNKLFWYDDEAEKQRAQEQMTAPEETDQPTM
jgi:hypothetical protein